MHHGGFDSQRQRSHAGHIRRQRLTLAGTAEVDAVCEPQGLKCAQIGWAQTREVVGAVDPAQANAPAFEAYMAADVAEVGGALQ